MESVWHSTDLIREIVSYQHGICFDMYSILKVLQNMAWDNSDIFNTLPAALAPFHQLFKTWFQTHGVRGLRQFPLRYSIELWYYSLLFGNVPMINYYHDHMPVDYVEWNLAVISGKVDAVSFLLKEYPHGCFYLTMERAIEHGNLNILKILHQHGIPFPANSWKIVCEYGRLNIATYLHQEHWAWKESWRGQATEVAAEKGHLNMIQFLHENNYDDAYTYHAMDAAAANGHLDIVRYLYVHRTEGCSSLAISEATRYGHLDVVKFLHQYYESDQTTKKMEIGPLDITRYLNDDVTCTKGWSRFRHKINQLLGNKSKQHFRELPRLI
ncbi:hypothetical protein THRCLA_00462 [Thraustotheca clavata]|uniref:Uncharacterized protein n=1 Tax=Thraustotheca clavata TaxID=74557 RepID=A0A1W0AB87_9STRA|nr:hypothetical protein THRCLA_00462 [Thraustotheca clavata]